MIPAVLSLLTATTIAVGPEWRLVDTISSQPVVPPFLTTSLRDGMDPKVSPCEDFDRFVNGAWQDRTAVPDSLRHVNSFTTTYHATQHRIGALLDSARQVTSSTDDAELRVLGAYFESCLSADSIPKALDRVSMFRAPPTDTNRVSRCRRLAMHHLPDALGQAFVRSVLTPRVRATMNRVLIGIRYSVTHRVSELSFVPPDAKERTLDALRYMAFKVAEPSDTVDYSTLQFPVNNFDAVLKAIQEHTIRYRLTDRTGEKKLAWSNSQYNPNAHFNPGNNSIEIPTFLFQWPFFDEQSTDAALSFAAAGTVIGHEIIHGVVHKLNSEGDASVRKHAQRLVEQYSKLPPIDGVHFDGRSSLNENLADLGGVLAAFDAWSMAVNQSGSPTIEGFTPEQRFFVHYARMWRSKSTKDALRAMAGAPHSPGRNRVNGVVANVPAFAQAFGCKEGDPMATPANERAIIW